MPALTVRNLPAEVHARLRVRAARRGRSVEAEVRSILEKASHEEDPVLDSATELRAWVRQLYGGSPPTRTVEDLITDRRRESAKE